MDDARNKPSANILVIDDDAVNLKLVGGLLSERGYTVRLLSEAQMALRAAQAKPPDLVLLDIRLPDMDGYTVCAALKADPCTHEVPVIFCSALGETIDKVRAFEVGGVDYIAKPYDAEEVLARVATHITLRRMQRQLQQHYDQLQQEVAERKRAEAQARQSRDELATQLAISEHIVSTLELAPLLERILQELQQIERFDGATICIVEGEALVIHASHSAHNPAQLLGVHVDLQHAKALRTVLTTRQPLILADRLLDADEQEYLERLIGDTRVVRSWMGIPLIVKDQIIGVLTLFYHQVDYYGSRAQARVQLFANQAALAIENAQLYQAAQEAGALRERERIARDLHDAVSQSLFSASLIAEGLRNARDVPDIVRQGIEDLRQLTRGAQAEMRALLHEMHAGGLTDKPMGNLLDVLCTAFISRARIPVALSVTGADQLQPQVQEMLYRIAQEALNNISKHAAANAVRVALTCSLEEVVLVIADDGRGFDAANRSHTSLGIGIMRDRATKIGAQLQIDSQPGTGTTITAIWRAAASRSVAAPDTV
jgi:two-component system nitrate/nitrite sensor histidine kinase NarX